MSLEKTRRTLCCLQHDRFGGGSLMVWGGISIKGCTDLYWLENGSLPLGIRMKSFNPSSDPTLMKWVLLMNDNARPRVARVCKQYLEDEGIDDH